MSVERTEERRISSIETTLIGPLSDVLDAIESEMFDYDPRGYGTRVHEITWHPGGNGELRVRARVTRAKSCD